MKLNGDKTNFEDLLKDINWNDNKLMRVNSQMELTKYQIEVLKRNNISYESATSLNNLVYLINNSLEETEDEELELIFEEISERNYYENTNK